MVLFLFTSSAIAIAPIIGGWGNYRYQYMPELLQPPPGTVMVNCHGLVIDEDHNIYLTYENDHKKDPDNCLIRWRSDGTGGEHMTGGNSTLCSGTPHGLKIAKEWEGGVPTQYLYHANNDQKLTKTKLDGTIVWQRNGNFGQDPTVAYKPTWFAVPPHGDFIYLCDGYGSNNVYVFNRHNGTFMNKTFGGKGGRDQHGKFATNHGCTYDPRNGKIAVSDRANSRIEYFDFDPKSPSKFEYSYTVDMQPTMGKQTLPCNLRMYPDLQAMAISPDLAVPVAVLDATNTVVSVVNVSVLLAAEEHKHPHGQTRVRLPNLRYPIPHLRWPYAAARPSPHSRFPRPAQMPSSSPMEIWWWPPGHQGACPTGSGCEWEHAHLSSIRYTGSRMRFRSAMRFRRVRQAQPGVL